MSDTITITTGHYAFTIPLDDREAVIAHVHPSIREVVTRYLDDADAGATVAVSLPMGDVLLDAMSTVEREREDV